MSVNGRRYFSALSVTLVAFLSQSISVSASDHNIVFVVIDTLRADHLGCYGYKHAKTPNIDNLASTGTKFIHTYSQIPFTLPSHASMFTSTYPMWNGVTDSAGPPLAKEHLTVAEIFKENGYATAAFTAAFVVDHIFQLDQGFDYYYDDFPFEEMLRGAIEEQDLRRSADDVLKPALRWIEGHRERKFFTWIHFYDPHHPYHPPEPYRSRYPRNPYDAEIAYVDAALGRLIGLLHQLELTEKTAIVLTSDHGEGLGDHQELYHGYYVYNSTLKVPLILKAPYLKDPVSEVTVPVRLLDVAPTLLQLASIAIPAQFQGRSLLPLVLGRKREADAIYSDSPFANMHFGWGMLRSLVLGRYKLIQAPRPELFDLERDPGETVNVYDSTKAMANSMQAEIARIVGSYARNNTAEPETTLGQEALESLRALGYIGAPSRSVSLKTENVPDPKDKIQLYNLYLQAAAQRASGKLTEATTALLKFLELDPNPSIVHYQLGSVYSKMSNYPKALSSFQNALRLNPEAEATLLALAQTYSDMNDFREAVATYQRVLQLKPRSVAALSKLGWNYLKLGQWNEAVQTLERAVREGSNLKDTFYFLGIGYLRQNRLKEAISQFKRVLELDPENADAQYNLGMILSTLGQREEAVIALRKAISTRPQFAEAHLYLGSVYASQGSLDAGLKEFQEALRIRPAYAEAHFNLGSVYARQGRVDEAIKAYQNCLAVRPDFAKAYLGLAAMYHSQGKEKEATDAMEAARRLELKGGSSR